MTRTKKLVTKRNKVVETPMFVPVYKLPYDFEAVASDEQEINDKIKHHVEIGKYRNIDKLGPISLEMDYQLRRYFARICIAVKTLQDAINIAKADRDKIAKLRNAATELIDKTVAAHVAVGALPIATGKQGERAQEAYLLSLDVAISDLKDERESLRTEYRKARVWIREANAELDKLVKDHVEKVELVASCLRSQTRPRVIEPTKNLRDSMTMTEYIDTYKTETPVSEEQAAERLKREPKGQSGQVYYETYTPQMTVEEDALNRATKKVQDTLTFLNSIITDAAEPSKAVPTEGQISSALEILIRAKVLPTWFDRETTLMSSTGKVARKSAFN